MAMHPAKGTDAPRVRQGLSAGRGPRSAVAHGSSRHQRWEIEAFYDGDCPICVREMEMLRRLDRKGKIRFVDIASKTFRAEDYALTNAEFMSEIHGRLHDGHWVRGVEVFRRLYGAVGWRPIVWISRLPILRGILDYAYRAFARNRMRWTGRGKCSDGDCVRR